MVVVCNLEINDLQTETDLYLPHTVYKTTQ